MNELLGMKVIQSPLLEPGTAYLIDPKALLLGFKPIKMKFRRDGLQSNEYDVNKVPEDHLPIRLVTHKVELFPGDRYRLNNELIDIFGTRPAFRFRPIFNWGMRI